MDDIKELVLLTRDQDADITALLKLSSRAPEKLESFYEMLQKEELNTDAEAAAHFFKDEPNNTNYQKLKSDLLKRLIIIFFYLNVKKTDEADRRTSFYRHYFRWSVAVNLNHDGATKTPHQLIREIYEEAKYYEFTDLAQLAAEALSDHYLDVEVNLPLHQHYLRESDWYEEVIELEDKAELLYAQLAAKRANQKAWTRESNQQAKDAYDQIARKINQVNTYRFRLCAYLIESGIYLAENDYKKVNEVSRKAIDFFKQKPFDVKVPLQIFYYQKLLGHIQLKQYEAGKTTAHECIQFLEEGTYNWFKYCEAYFLLLSHTGNYQEACELLGSAQTHERYPYLPDNIREIWKVYYAYVSLLVKWGKIKEPGQRKTAYLNYDAEQLFDQISIYAKDKKGMNVAVQIIYLLHLIQNKEFDILSIKVDALKKYSSRYLKTEGNERSKLFLKLLLLIHIYPYERENFEKKSARLLEKLRAVPFDISRQSAEIEIIPFETLWKLVVDSL